MILRLFSGPIARATISTTGVLGLRLLVQAGTLLIVARMLGAADFGAYSAVAALAVMLGSMATLGTHLILMGAASKDKTRRHAILPYALPTTLLTGSLLFSLYCLLAFGVLHEAKISGLVILALGVAELLLHPLIMLATVEHQAHGHIARSQMLMTMPVVLRLVVAVGVWMAKPAEPLTVFALGYLLATAIAVLLAVWHLPEPWPKPWAWRWARKAELRESMGFAALNFSAIGSSELDKTIAVKLMPLGSAGVYAAGARVIGAVTLPVIALMQSALPRLFRESMGEAARSARLLRWLFAAALAYSLVLAAALWLVAPLFGILFGQQYAGIDNIIRWLALAVPGMALRITAGSVLMAMGKPWLRVGFELSGLLILILASLILVPVSLNHGMPLAVAIGESFMAAIGISLVIRTRRNGISLHKEI
ncbi:MAG: lipopolysaccharide biosynthesis protein [Halothiobacillus sp.]|nr:lipopolysaccharide biosynthesis protein [Halothiobacillus sp.]